MMDLAGKKVNEERRIILQNPSLYSRGFDGTLASC
jgi:hypothetical protein